MASATRVACDEEAMATAARAMATRWWASNRDEGDGDGDGNDVGNGDCDKAGG